MQINKLCEKSDRVKTIGKLHVLARSRTNACRGAFLIILFSLVPTEITQNVLYKYVRSEITHSQHNLKDRTPTAHTPRHSRNVSGSLLPQARWVQKATFPLAAVWFICADRRRAQAPASWLFCFRRLRRCFVRMREKRPRAFRFLAVRSSYLERFISALECAPVPTHAASAAKPCFEKLPACKSK